MSFAQLSAFRRHIYPDNTMGFWRAVWTWWLNHVAEREKDKDPGLHREPVNESRRVRTKPLE